ncbi:MAG TPA: papain-like cysteine protease family protein [Pyrinomonadaceae bacterium]|nr:hypothetical protein [Chloracidobacterium sp.]MBP9936987.1 hypothetical protein [Pyrinomonadaceae bacterium]MBK7801852.1 hypothetical protein [Chloracidobacterium sp.]MBK9438004.1 hypothetical protein [Chloracidobacterium sp.]MBK9765561.1 hypothetical protein [Chloracidobacterium sp.]
MSARFRTDSRGRTHYLLHQEMSQSCGPACVAMAESFYKLACMMDPESRARQLSQNYPGKFTAAGGTGAENLAYVLNAEGVPSYAGTGVPPNKIFDYFWKYLGERTKIIAHIAWSGGGGHFTMLTKIDADHKMIFLDPWYDIVEVPRASLPSYNVGGASGTLSGWLTITHR